MNIEHAYFERTGEYQAFPGICLVDTFELAESKQAPLFTAEKYATRGAPKTTSIFVVIGNPPYNVGQVQEEENNRNRKYPTLDRRLSETYAEASVASSVSKLSDPYVKAMRWASDRIGKEGLVVFVTNNSFLEQIAFDGMRRCLAKDFDQIHILDLGGNVRKEPEAVRHNAQRLRHPSRRQHKSSCTNR